MLTSTTDYSFQQASMHPQAPLPSSLGSERPVHTVTATSVRLKEGGTCRDTASRMQSHGSASASRDLQVYTGTGGCLRQPLPDKVMESSQCLPPCSTCELQHHWPSPKFNDQQRYRCPGRSQRRAGEQEACSPGRIERGVITLLGRVQ